MKKYLMGIDSGGTFCKVAIFDKKGKQIASVQEQISYDAEEDGRAERDMTAMRDCTFQAIRTAMTVSNISASQIAGVGLSGHGKGLYVLDRESRVFTKGILSVDTRAVAIKDAFARGEAGRYARAHNHQNVLACQPVCLLRWLKENDRATYDRIGTVFSAKDYIRYCLTGKIHAEITDLSGTNLLNLDTKDYDDKLLTLFGICEIRDSLPAIVGSFEVVGGVTADVSKCTGLEEGTPVAGGMFDIDACGLACGMVDPSAVTMIAGTWAINEFISPRPVSGLDAPMNSLYCLDGYYLVEECSATSSANLQWWMDRVDGNLTYQQVNRLVSVTPPDSDVFFLPFVTGSSVGDRANGTLIGLTAHCGKEHILRAVYEGVALNAKWQLERLLRYRSRPACIRLAGGLTKSVPWVQIFADILQIPVEISDEGERELGCFGAAIAAGVAAGIYESPEMIANIQKTKRIDPDPSRRALYEKKYAKYLDLIETLMPFWGGSDASAMTGIDARKSYEDVFCETNAGYDGIETTV